MSLTESNIIADAAALQKADSFTGRGWLKTIAPAKVNLFLGIGARRADGYHEATSVMHALNLHDVVYLRREDAAPGTGLAIEVEMFGRGDVKAPDVPLEKNIITRALRALAVAFNRTTDELVRVHVEKNIPAEAGLAGGSTDAAAALVGACRLWDIDPASQQVEQAARSLGSDVAFFLHGGCASFVGTGDTFVRTLVPMKCSVVLAKPAEGVSTKLAYETFDANPTPIPADATARLEAAGEAVDVPLFNNLAPASEALLPQLAGIRSWLASQEGVRGTLLCGSGSCTFAICDSHDTASAIVVEARKRGLWARATSFGSVRALVIDQEGGTR